MRWDLLSLIGVDNALWMTGCLPKISSASRNRLKVEIKRREYKNEIHLYINYGKGFAKIQEVL